MTWDGLKACRTLAGDGIQANVTLCFTPAQALLAAKAGATFVSPFVGRLDDVGQDGMALIGDIVEIFRNYRDRYPTEVLVASVRHPGHVIEAARLGADVATLPPKVLHQLVAASLDRQGARGLPQGLGGDRPEDRRLTASARAPVRGGTDRAQLARAAGSGYDVATSDGGGRRAGSPVMWGALLGGDRAARARRRRARRPMPGRGSTS